MCVRVCVIELNIWAWTWPCSCWWASLLRWSTAPWGLDWSTCVALWQVGIGCLFFFILSGQNALVSALPSYHLLVACFYEFNSLAEVCWWIQATEESVHTYVSVSVCGTLRTDGFVSSSSQSMRQDVGGCKCSIKSPTSSHLYLLKMQAKSHVKSNLIRGTLSQSENKHGAYMTERREEYLKRERGG